ncbi:hypothetical protein HK097_002922 [Rhizophlyctis rosea]|uniref:SET domain-containing protein n=1 Tax=Rhizophlyctis rosea TaxID=64517 RepID=A0AAD5S4P7_9FUNG|nr:hypothetical protein HK097_002922 [Rhizophlyctis rosea]
MLHMFSSVGAANTYLSGAFAYNIPLQHKIRNNFTTDKTIVKRSPIHDHGLFAAADMPKGTKIIKGNPMCYDSNPNIHQHLRHTSLLEMQNPNAVSTFMEPSAICRIIIDTKEKQIRENSIKYCKRDVATYKTACTANPANTRIVDAHGDNEHLVANVDIKKGDELTREYDFFEWMWRVATDLTSPQPFVPSSTPASTCSSR